MLNKKLMILTIFFVLLLAVSAVSANENIDKITSSDDTNGVTTDDVINAVTNDIANNDTLETILDENLEKVVEETNEQEKIYAPQDDTQLTQDQNDEKISNTSYMLYSIDLKDEYQISSYSNGKITGTISPPPSYMPGYSFKLYVYDGYQNIVYTSNAIEGRATSFSNTIPAKTLLPGTYIIAAINDYESHVMDTAILNVSGNVVITANDYNAYYNSANMTIRLTDSVTGKGIMGNVKGTFSNGMTINLTTDLDGYASFTPLLDPGTYNITFSPCEEYLFANSTQRTVTIKSIFTPKNKTINLFVGDFSKVNYTVESTSIVDQITFVTSNESVVQVDSKSGNIIACSEGTANITIIFSGNEYYPAYRTNVTITISRITPKIVIPSLDKLFSTDSITIDLPKDAKGTITLIIASNPYSFQVNNGVCNVNMPNLSSGDYNYTITYSGDYKYSPFNDNGTITIMNRTIKANDMTVKYGEQTYFTATFYESNGSSLTNKYIIFKVNDDEYPIKTDSNGIARLPIELAPGEYNITLINDFTGEIVIKKLIVKPADPKPIDDEDINISSLNTGSGVIRLPSDASGTITLDIAGSQYKFSVVNGVANVKLPELSNGNYGYIISYSGDAKYTPFLKTGSVTVNKQTTPSKPVVKTTLTLKTVTIKKSAKKLVLQATLKQGNNALSSKKITFKFNGKKYTAKTNKKGVAKLTIKKNVLKKLKVGKKITYSATYGKVTKKVTVKVKK